MAALRKFGFAFLLAAWFLFFSRDVLSVRFAPDDMMNIDNFYWSPGPWRLFYSQFLIWRGYYRPMGGLFYLPILAISKLNPAPFHVVLSLIALGCVFLVYWVARSLGCGQVASGLAALVACYHAGLANFYYNTAFVYDALCGFFFLAAFGYYASVRNRDRLLRRSEKLIFLALFICALNSKEMALTLPAVILLYEWIFQGPAKRHRSAWVGWLRGAGSLVWIASLLAALDLYGKVFGVDALTGMEGYRPVFSWQRLIDYQKTFFSDAAFLHLTGGGLLAVWLILTYLAWRPGARAVLRFSWAWLILTSLPIEFLPGKSQACLYIPMLGLTVFVSVVIADLVRALADWLSDEPIFRQLGPRAVTCLLVAVAIFFWGRENLRRQQHDVKPVMAALGAQTWQVIEQFRALNPHVRPHSHVLFLHDPFTEWDMLFIADLWFQDRTLSIRLQRLTPLPEDAVSQFDTVFDYSGGKLIRVR